MNTLDTKQRAALSDVRRNESELSVGTKQLMSLGDHHGWDFRLLGKAPLPDKPTRLGDWLLVPAQEDTSPIPARSIERIQAIFAAGIRPQGFVLVHEAPMLLPPSTTDQRTRQITTAPTFPQQLLPEGFEDLIRATIPVLTTLATIATSILAVTATSIIPATLMVGALLLDPILVAVTEDGHWIEIDRWWNQYAT